MVVWLKPCESRSSPGFLSPNPQPVSRLGVCFAANKSKTEAEEAPDVGAGFTRHGLNGRASCGTYHIYEKHGLQRQSPVPTNGAAPTGLSSSEKAKGPAVPGLFAYCGLSGYTRPNTSVALVPPKPKLFDITVASLASCVCRRIGKSAARSSSVSMFAEPAMKPSRSISRL